MTIAIEIISRYRHTSIKIIPIRRSSSYCTIFLEIISFSSYEDEILSIFYIVDKFPIYDII